MYFVWLKQQQNKRLQHLSCTWKKNEMFVNFNINGQSLVMDFFNFKSWCIVFREPSLHDFNERYHMVLHLTHFSAES